MLLAGIAAAALPVAGGDAAGEVFGDETVEPATPATPGGGPEAALDLALHYTTAFEIADTDDDDLAGLINDSSQLVALADRPTATYTGLVRRAEGDVERLGAVLRSEGYYDGKVSFAIDEAVSPAVVTVSVLPGQRYRLQAYEIAWSGGAAPDGVELAPGLQSGMPAEAKPIADVQSKLVDALQAQGRPFARVAERVALIDRNARTMTVTLTLDAGAPATFGPTAITGLTGLDPAFVRGKVPWREGERFDQTRIDDLRTTLLALGQFSSVKIEHAAAARADGSLPVTIALVEAMPRSVGAGAAYSTSEGFLLDVFWEHRNLFGAAEKLRLSGTAGTLTQRAKADFRKPDFWRIDQDLLANSALIRTNSDAFDETTWANFLGLERKLSDRWRASAGGSFELAQLTDQQSTETVQLFGVPLSATRDNRDDVLNPTRGSLLGFDLVPYIGHGSEALTFLHGSVSASGYLAFDERRRVVVAGRTRIASLVGEEVSAIPANKRLYAGGGGSIRGYEFQKVGPLDGENDPLGGRSLFELGLELRLRVTDEIGIVPFVEGGNVRADTVPDPFGHLQWAGGLGLRYYTAIGPARIDFAVPLNKRRNIDDDFQVYFSFGQAF